MAPESTPERNGTVDTVAPYSNLVLTTRICTIAVSVTLVAAGAPHPPLLWACTVLAVGYGVARCWRPIRYDNDTASVIRVLGEVAFYLAMVLLSGQWSSPLVFLLLNAVIVAGFARGFGFALRVAITTSVAVSAATFIATPDDRVATSESASWSMVVVLVALVAGYARRLSGEAERERALALDRVGRLADANDLLFSLHRVAQSLPESLDLADVLDSTMQRIRTMLDCESAALLLFDETDAQWDIARHHGLPHGGRLGPTELPNPMRRAIANNATVHVEEHSADSGGGLSSTAGSGIYTVLIARDVIIGLLSVEHGNAGHFGPRDVELVEGLVAPASLAVDNARWFARLRTLGADEERTRIARELHDRIGQSLAYLSIELDRLVDHATEGRSIDGELERVRDDVRGVTREVRETLYDLRTDVSDKAPIDRVLAGYGDRVAERSGIQVRVDADHDGRLPMLQEREMWRIAQETLTNVERHASATAVRIVWRCDGERAVLDITDNGVGFEEGIAGRLDSYGVVGMRERAASIGASLEIISAPGRGTRVRCSVGPQELDSKAPLLERGHVHEPGPGARS